MHLEKKPPNAALLRLDVANRHVRRVRFSGKKKKKENKICGNSSPRLQRKFDTLHAAEGSLGLLALLFALEKVARVDLLD